MKPNKQASAKSFLTFGWQVTPTQDPRYWLDNTARPGAQPDSELIKVPAHTIANHTAVIAQSGSGKSFFLGRIIEEIMLQTKARCVILDPNADFRKVYKVEAGTLWEKAVYKPIERRGKLPHEASRADFEASWSQVSIRIRTGRAEPEQPYEQLKLWWPSLSMTFFAEDIDPMLRSDLYHCHAFVQALGTLVEYKCFATKEPIDLIDEAQRIFRLARGLPKEDLRAELEPVFNAAQLTMAKAAKDVLKVSDDWVYIGSYMLVRRSVIEREIERFIESALTLSDYVSQDVERFYFGKAREYQAAGILRTVPKIDQITHFQTSRLDVIDLPSLPDKNTQLLAINAILTTEWEQARNNWSYALEQDLERDDRVPTFIVVDEAHNLIPSEPRSKVEFALREQFRTIIAEGRKYGLFLILVSQRPDKLDPLVISECENKAVMRLGSGSVLDITREMLGLGDLPPKLLEKCLEFETGRVLLVGRWVPDGPQIIYSAARRTVEGGRNLRSEYWSVPQEMNKLPEDQGAKRKTNSARVPNKTSKKRSGRLTRRQSKRVSKKS